MAAHTSALLLSNRIAAGCVSGEMGELYPFHSTKKFSAPAPVVP